MALCAWTNHLAAFAVGCLMMGISQAVFILARQSYLAEAVPVESRARAMSTLGDVMRIGMFIGPIVAAVAIHRFGLGGAYVVGMAALAMSALIAARLPESPTSTGTDLHPGTGAGMTPSTLCSTLRDHRRV